MNGTRLTLFAGHYGSGKTNLAVNYACWLRQTYDKVLVADLDIVNPYFRTKDAEEWLQEKDIRIISSRYANTNLEAPAMPPEALALFDDKSICGVIDVGGDDRGAYAVGKYARFIKEEPSCSCLLVINRYRPLTKTPQQAIEMLHEIEAAAHFSFTGIVNNSNLGADTTKTDVLQSLAYAREVSALAGLPIAFTAVKESLLPSLRGEVADLFGLSIITKNSWRIENGEGKL